MFNLVKTPCKISEPQDNPFWEKSNPRREKVQVAMKKMKIKEAVRTERENKNAFCEKSMTDQKIVQRYISELNSLFHTNMKFGSPPLKVKQIDKA